MYNRSAGGLLLPASPSDEKGGRGGGKEKGVGRVKGRRRKGEKKNSGDRKTEKPRNRKEKSEDGEGHVGYEGATAQG